METTHPTLEELEQFIRGSLDDEAAAPIERHLEKDLCSRCLFATRKLMAEAEPDLRDNIRRFTRWDELPAAERRDGLGAAMRQAMRRGVVIRAERALGPELLAELERRSPTARRAVIRTAERYQLFGFVEFLCHASREAVFRDVARALELAGLAVEVADSLDPRIYVAKFTTDMQALAHAYLGNARRVASDLFGAEGAFQQALLLREQGTQGSPVYAEIGSLLGSLRIDQGRYLEARTILQEALALYRSFGFEREQGKILVKLADVEGYSGSPEKAVEILEEAVEQLQTAGAGRLLAYAHRNLTDWMVDADQALEALARYRKARELYDEHFQEPALGMRRRWLEGRIYAALGDLDLAVGAFEEVRGAAAERELSYEAAMVSLELAIVHLDRGEVAQVQDLVEEMTPIFRSHELHRHALAAVYLFRHAARSQTLTTGFAREILRYLRRARNNPYERFEPSARWS